MLLGTAMRDAARGSNAQTNYELSTARYTAGIRCISSRLSSQNLRGANAENIIRAIIGLTCYDVGRFVITNILESDKGLTGYAVPDARLLPDGSAFGWNAKGHQHSGRLGGPVA